LDWVHLHYIKDLKKEKIDTALKNKKSPIRPKALKFLYLRAKIRRILARRKAPPRNCGAGWNNRSQKMKTRLFRKIGSSLRIWWLPMKNHNKLLKSFCQI